MLFLPVTRITNQPKFVFVLHSKVRQFHLVTKEVYWSSEWVTWY